MQSENPLIADFVKLMNSAAGTLAGVGREAGETAREKVREVFGGLDFVSREEFDAVKTMASKARTLPVADGKSCIRSQRKRTICCNFSASMSSLGSRSKSSASNSAARSRALSSSLVNHSPAPAITASSPDFSRPTCTTIVFKCDT